MDNIEDVQGVSFNNESRRAIAHRKQWVVSEGTYMSAHLATQPSTAPYTIDPQTCVGPVELRIADLERSLRFYEDVIGLQVISQSVDTAFLGVAGQVLLVLRPQSGLQPVPQRATGLYHFAILVPSPADLGHALRRMIVANIAVGQGDHLVSEALYLSDPDGNGIEVYRDRPRDTWRWRNGLVEMATDPVDLHALLTAAEHDNGSATVLPTGTTMGHVHLKVADIAQAQAFFVDTLGFGVTAQMPSALFVSAGGYHHHFGLNTWHSRGAAPGGDDVAGLTSYTIVVANTVVRDQVLGRLDAARTPYTLKDDQATFYDPWKNRVVLVVESTHNA